LFKRLPEALIATGTSGCYSQRHTSSAQWVMVGFTALQHCAVVSGTDAKVFATVLICFLLLFA
jgi:hypothetical protein